MYEPDTPWGTKKYAKDRHQRSFWPTINAPKSMHNKTKAFIPECTDERGPQATSLRKWWTTSRMWHWEADRRAFTQGMADARALRQPGAYCA